MADYRKILYSFGTIVLEINIVTALEFVVW